MHPSNSDTDMSFRTVACALPSELVEKLDRRLQGKDTLNTRANYLRLAILKAAHEDGLIKLTLDDKGRVYSLDLLSEAAA